ncbi:MAG: XisI protein [Blastocatellia bacterium]
MDRVRHYRETIERVINEVLQITPSTDETQYKAMFDRGHDRYAMIAVGWEGPQRVLDIIIYLEIINGKVWLQADNTDLAIARDLERAGISKHEIVLGMHPPDVRPYTEYAAA